MSRLELGKIIASRSANDPNNYVAGIISSESGPLIPTLITDEIELDGMYDDFKYKSMYGKLLSHNIPSVLTPVITGVSPYNRSSIRLNSDDAYVKYTHPKIYKKYKYKRQGNLVVNRTTIPVNELEVSTLSKYPVPYLLVNSNNEIEPHTICTAKYYQDELGYFKIQFNFNKEWVGNIVVASYPDFDKIPGILVPETANDHLIITNNKYSSFSLSGKVIPDFVILNSLGYEIPEYDAYIENIDENYTFYIKLINETSGSIYIRKLTEDVVYSQELTQEITKINHGLGYYPNIKEFDYNKNIIKFIDPIRTDNQTITNISTNELEIKIDNLSYPSYIEHIPNVGDNIIYPINNSSYIMIQSTIKYPVPYTILSSTGSDYEVIESTAVYEYNYNGYSIITIKLNKNITGAVILNNFLTDNKTPLVVEFTNNYSFEIKNNILPLVVCIDEDGNKVQVDTSIKKENGRYFCTIGSYSNIKLTAFIQILDQEIHKFNKLITDSTTEILTGLNYNPYARVIVNKEGELKEYVASINYNSIDNEINKSYIVSVDNYNSPIGIQYCILLESDRNKIDVNQLRLDEVTYSMVLDFTNASDIDLNNIDDLYNRYLLLKINGSRILYIRVVNIEEPIISNDYYDELVTIYSNTIPDIIEELKLDISKRITSENLIQYKDECIKSLESAWEYASTEIPDGEPTLSAGVSYEPSTATLITTTEWSGIRYRFDESFNEKVIELQITTFDLSKLKLIVTYSDGSQVQYSDLVPTNYRCFSINKNKLLKIIEVISEIPDTIFFDNITLITLNDQGSEIPIELDLSLFSADQFSDNDYYDWKDLLIEKLYENELFLGSYKTLIDFVNSNLTITTELPMMIQLINESDKFLINKLLINYQFPSSNLNFYKFDGLKLYTCFNSEQDILSEFTEDSKLVEFYSKIKGIKGQNIIITIDEISDYYYEIKIQLDSIIEYFYVYTKKTDLTPIDAEDIHIISMKSKLVDIKIYDYILPSGQVIDQYDFIDYYDMTEFDPNRLKIVKLPEGTYKLNRNMSEYPDYNDWNNTLNSLSDSGFYPDLFLVPEIYEHHELQQYKDVLSFVRGNEPNLYGGICNSGVFSQALCTIRWKYLQNPNPEKLPDVNNRILYFYDDLELDNNQYPTFYPYIESIIRGTGLEIPNELILTTPNKIKVGNAIIYHNQPYLIKDIMKDGTLYCIDSNDNYKSINPKYCTLITTLLDKLNINYLDYNGLYYYHITWKEKVGQPSIFIVQYSCSKVSREFYKAKGVLVSTNFYTIQNVIINLISRILNITPYINLITHEININGRQVNIKLLVELKGLINKKFLIDYILNLS